MKSSARLLWLFLMLTLLPVYGQEFDLETKVKQTMKTATKFMMDKVSYQGGFVWQYLPDLSRSWGELEARRTMVWIQPPGTPMVGNLLIDAFEATGDKYYLKAALKVAKTLIKGQLPCGGWNYVFDLAGEDSLKSWYETIGKNAWRLEEFQHYYGNATFDDGGTIEAGTFLLRLSALSTDKAVSAAVEKVVQLVLESQFPSGGWPQRFPLMAGFSKNGLSDYSGFITLNDDVLQKNIDFLLRCDKELGRPELKAAALKAMSCCRDLQQKEPYAGWADQYTPDGKPAHARTYEPRAINTATTIGAVNMMMDFYLTTDDSSFLSGIPAALRFVESQKLPDSMVALSGKGARGNDSFMTPRFIDPDNGQPLYVHRKGSNVVNGKYFVNQDISHTIVHYSSQAFIDLKPVWKAYENIHTQDVPQNNDRFFDQRPINRILEMFDSKGYWKSPLITISNPFIGTGSKDGGETTTYAETMAGDKFDTSCYQQRVGESCISTAVYIQNMQRLIRYLKLNEPTGYNKAQITKR